MKSILEVKGIKVLDKQQQSFVNGGDGWEDVCAAAQVSGSWTQCFLCPNWGDCFGEEDDKK